MPSFMAPLYWPLLGQAKSKKTFLCTALVGALLREGGATSFGIKPSKSLVLWVDTEQSANHVLKVIQRMQRIAGVDPTQPYELLKVLTLREIEPKERFNILRDAIAKGHINEKGGVLYLP